ncbi:MAG: nucleotidyltransferase family protein [Clostridia bacterium]|nr:nucleotidyltransferase family protein [Clostridia bacterium]
MRICGVVSEYNPFHKGHAHQISEAKARLGEDSAVVCCMSSDFVQRGDAAILPKHLRAKAAVLGGADVVLELPAPYALRSAEGFAQSAVDILLGLGVLTDLSFGAEDADADLLKETASLLLEHQTVQDTLLHLKTGISYAAARERALFARVKEKAEILQKPNNILAIEYCKALIRRESDVNILPIARKGAGHDAGAEGEFASASHIRELLREGKTDEALPYLPETTAEILQEAMAQGQALVDRERLENAMLSTLVRLNADHLASLPDANEGLDNRLLEAIRKGRSIEDICAQAKTKRYALSRIRRMVFCAWLGITKDESATPPPYARVLAFSDKGREVLKAARKQATLPLITKPAHAFDLGGDARMIFEREALACDLYNLALPCWKDIRWGDDWRQDAIYVK